MVVIAVGVGACGSASSGTIVAPRASRLVHWRPLVRLVRPVDVVASIPGGRVIAAADGRLWLVRGTRGIAAFASGPGGYVSAGGAEPYIALSPGGCFGAGSVYAIRLKSGRGVIRIDAAGLAVRFARIDTPGLISGIAFDTTGRFEHRLLVTVTSGANTTVEAINCQGAVQAITDSAPRVEGGVAVAPPTFGRFAGDLIAPDEHSGRVFAITPRGTSQLVAQSGLPYGGDIGVESEAFIPAGPPRTALVADRRTPGNRHPGDDVLLALSWTELRAAGARVGDLLVAAEGGGLTDDIRCGPVSCRVRYLANGPAIAHVEGHIAFVPFALADHY